jgi:hypothetical protein
VVLETLMNLVAAPQEALEVDLGELIADPFGATARYRELTPVIRNG